ncbi:hypothetical protein A1O3_05146, partial [Capronia epimyces CBS 606.96]
QSTPSEPPTHPSSEPPLSRATTATAAASDVAGPNDAATKLAEAIDDFLGDLEKKFKGISDEILTKRELTSEPRDLLVDLRAESFS